MTTILHVASSSNLQGSVTRQIGPLVVANLKQSHPGAKIIERDLIKTTLPHLSPEFLGAMFAGKSGAPELALSRELIGEVLASDVLVIEVPMYNFGIPSVLKAWIDHVIRKGETFNYSDKGPVGLATGKKTILIVGRGGIYSDGPYKAMDYQETYMRAVLGFIGITDIEVIRIEGVAMGPEKIAESLAAAKAQARSFSKKAA